LRDPDGIWLELVEKMPIETTLGGTPNEKLGPSVVGVTISVGDLELVEKFWMGVLGLKEYKQGDIHNTEDEELWGLVGGVRDTLVLESGELALEFVQYQSPVGRNRPAGYLLSDQGILNVAFGCTDKREFHATYERALQLGYVGITQPWTVPDIATVVYLTDSNGFSVELLHVEPSALARMGFVANS
jgi:catechol 2,3-dioxygenase-like lactoylglutathione lyase family enzyme